MNVVTVFGGSGFIGRYVVRELAKTGARVRVAIRRPDRSGFLRPMGDVGQIVPVGANVRNDASIVAAVQGSDTVINLVGVLFPSGQQSFQHLQANGAERVARSAQAAGAKTLVHVSALGADLNSRSIYASTKAAGEQLVTRAFPRATIIRPSVVFGPEDDFFNKFAALARLSPALPLIGAGRTKFQPVYVGDVASAIVRAAQSPKNLTTFYELGGPRVYNFATLMKMMLEQIDRRRILVPIPFSAATILATLTELSPIPVLTRDQVRLLRRDNILQNDAPGLKDLGIEATALETILPTYMKRFRRGTWHT